MTISRTRPLTRLNATAAETMPAERTTLGSGPGIPGPYAPYCSKKWATVMMPW